MEADAVGTGTSDGDGRRSVAATGVAEHESWFLHRLAPDSAAHVLCLRYRVDGAVDSAALGAAWLSVLDRHDVLRSTFIDVDGRVLRRIGVASDSPPTVLDLRRRGATDRRERAERACRAAVSAPFDLSTQPPARLTVVHLTDTDHVVLLALHRIAVDEESLSILVADLSAAYAEATTADGIAGSRRSSAPPGSRGVVRAERWFRRTAAGRTARDTSAADSSAADPSTTSGASAPDDADSGSDGGRDSARLLDWWTTTLTPPPPPLDLPADRPRPAEPSFAGDELRFDWGAEFSATLSAFAERSGSTSRVLLHTGLLALLHRVTGQERVAVGVPISLRRAADARRVAALRNTVVLGADFSPTSTFRQMLSATGRRWSEAVDHAEVPFSDVVRAVNPARDPRRMPLCDAVFDLRDTAAPPTLALAGAAVHPEPVHPGAAAVDLAVIVEALEPTITGRIEYRTSLFDPGSARVLLDQFRGLLRSAVAAPDVPVAELAMDSEDTLRAMLREGDLVDAGPPSEVPVHERVRGQAAARPEAVAVAHPTEPVVYRELVERAESVGRTLRAAGVTRGSAVVVRMSTSSLRIAALLAVLDLGAHLVWSGPGRVGRRGRELLADLRPGCLLVDRDPDTDELARWFAAEQSGRVVALSRRDDGARGAAASTDTVRAETGRDDRAYIAYTSGSTGRPKGVAHSHGSLAQYVTWFAEEFRIESTSRVAQWVTPEHDPALCEVFATLVAGATLCPVPETIRVHPEKLVDWLASERITHLQTVPSFARELLAVVLGSGSTERLADLSHLLLMGEALPPALADSLRAGLPLTRLVNLYGPTETIAATWYEIADAQHGAVPIGVPIPGREVLILDERDRLCPTGVVGEIVIRGPHVAEGYLGELDAGPDVFRRLPAGGPRPTADRRCYRTGDLGRRRPDGLLEFRGRRDFQVKLLGNRVELTEVETALAAHDSIAECAAVPVIDRDGLVSRLVLHVAPVPGRAGSPEVWRAHLRTRFGAVLIPASFRVHVDGLPRGAAGKVDRRGLGQRGPVPHPRSRQPSTPTERELAELWSGVLGTDGMRCDDDFFSLGGHSLLVPSMLRRVRERFGVTVPLWGFLIDPSLGGLAALVAVDSPRRDGGQTAP